MQNPSMDPEVVSEATQCNRQLRVAAGAGCGHTRAQHAQEQAWRVRGAHERALRALVRSGLHTEAEAALCQTLSLEETEPMGHVDTAGPRLMAVQLIITHFTKGQT